MLLIKCTEQALYLDSVRGVRKSSRKRGQRRVLQEGAAYTEGTGATGGVRKPCGSQMFSEPPPIHSAQSMPSGPGDEPV